jgi:hypothetical protein
MAQIEIYVVERERMMISSSCTDQLSKMLDESQRIKDSRWRICDEVLETFSNQFCLKEMANGD